MVAPAIPNTRAAPLASSFALSAWCIVAAFGTYFCMYAFRKPFTAATFSEYEYAGVGYKTLLVAAQLAGYTLSKFIGIRVVSEFPPHRRAAGILLLIGAAQTALLLFGLIPPPFNLACLFLNGLPLGMVFGLVLGFLEGRRVTEALAAGLCASFIVSDGVVKTVGVWLLGLGVSQWWMPFSTGVLFALPLLGFTWMLARIPPPSAADIAQRSQRPPMTRADRRQFFARYALGLSLLLLVYLLLTILRSIRSDFAVEIWQGLGLSGQPEVFAWSELVVMLGVVLVNGAAILIRDNRRAFFTALATSLGGFLFVFLALLGLAWHWLAPFPFMVLFGLGLYIPYVAVHTTIFERLIALLRDRGNLGYLMYLADAFGYLGYVGVMVARNFLWTGGTTDAAFLDFFAGVAWVSVAGSIVLLAGCWWYFADRTAPSVSLIAETPA